MSDNLPVPAYSVNDIHYMAEQVAKSGLFGLTAPQATALMLLCQADGLHPIQAIRRFHVIQGRPAMRSDAMLAEFQARGGVVEWRASTDDACEAFFAHPSCPKGFVSRFSLADAKRSDLAGKDTWRKYPGAMLRARVISQGVRAVLPGVVAGIYTPEEVADFVPLPRDPEPVATPPVEPEPAAGDGNGADRPPDPLARAMGRAVDQWHEFEPIPDEKEAACRWARLINGLTTMALDEELIDLNDISANGKSRDRLLVKTALRTLLADEPAWFDAAIRAFLEEHKERLRIQPVAEQA